MGASFFLVLVGIALMGCGIWIIAGKHNCKTAVQAVFIQNLAVPSGIVTEYAPMFRYTYRGETYERQSFETFSKRKAAVFVPGEQYTIYINEKRPTALVTGRKIRNGEVLLILVGFLGLFLAFVSWMYRQLY